MKHISQLTLLTALGFALTTSLLPQEAFANEVQTGTVLAPVLKIENFIGKVTINNAETLSMTGQAPDTLRQDARKLVIDGGEKFSNVNCRKTSAKISLAIGKKKWIGRSAGYKDLDQYPHLKVTVPENTKLIIKNSIVFGQSQTLGAADINVRSCGDLELGDITGPLDLKVNGSSNFQADNVGNADITITGSGDAQIAQAANVTVKVSGSGDIRLDDVQSLKARLTGAGDLQVGDVTDGFHVATSGSSDVKAKDINGTVDISGNGSSSVKTGSVHGNASIKLSGSGDVNIPRGEISHLNVYTTGSSDVRFNGVAHTAELEAYGSSDIHIKKITGTYKANSSRSADIHVAKKVTIDFD